MGQHNFRSWFNKIPEGTTVFGKKSPYYAIKIDDDHVACLDNGSVVKVSLETFLRGSKMDVERTLANTDELHARGVSFQKTKEEAKRQLVLQQRFSGPQHFVLFCQGISSFGGRKQGKPLIENKPSRECLWTYFSFPAK